MIAGGAGLETTTRASALLPGTVLVLALVVVLAAGIGAVVLRRRRRRLGGAATPAGLVTAGPVKLAGRVAAPGEPLIAPWSASEVVWHRSLLEQEVGQGNNRRWKNLTEETSAAPFLVVDDSGLVLVEPVGASVSAPRLHRQEHGGRPQRFGRLHLLGTLGGGSLLAGFHVDRHRTTEWQLRPGDPVVVLGTATPGKAGAPATLSARPHPLVVLHGEEHVVADRTGAEVLALWGLATVAAMTVPASLHALRTTLDGGPREDDPALLEAVVGQAIAVAVASTALALVLAIAGRLRRRSTNRFVAGSVPP